MTRTFVNILSLVRCSTVLWTALCAVAVAIAGTETPAVPLYRHGYYLFLDGGERCERCYVPLFITAEPLERIAKSKTDADGFLIVTYERDSIWEVKGSTSVLHGDIQPQPRIVRLKLKEGLKEYRYQEVGPAEVLKLLRSPEGTIPVHRLHSSSYWPMAPSREDLISAFQNLK
jgi:hypothetical protein